jgi:hypothetical protein
VVTNLRGRNTVINDLEGGINVDSDCEDESAGASEGTLKKEQDEEESRAVLIVGSFSAYVRFFAPSSY